MNNNMKTFIVIAAVVVLGAGAVVLKNNKSDDTSMGDMTDKSSTTAMDTSNTNVMMESTNQITYKGFSVVQKSITVKKGTTVTWTNQDNAKHDVTPDTATDEFKASELFGKGETHSVTFNTAGTYSYYCSPHPYMKGTIVVTE